MISWGPSIRIDGSELEGYHARRYQADVYRTLNTVVGVGTHFSVGHLVLIEIAKSKRKLHIRPMNPEIPNALANATGFEDRDQRVRVRKAIPEYNVCYDRVPIEARLDDTLRYNPETWRYRDSKRGWDAAANGGKGAWVDTTWSNPHVKAMDPDNQYFNSDDVLVHELFHEARVLQGWVCKLPYGHGFHNVEEMFAILVANIYRSERKRNHAIRADHAKTFNRYQHSAKQFYKDHRAGIDRMWHEMPDFCQAVANIDCDFNPLRARQEVEKEEYDMMLRMYGSDGSIHGLHLSR